MEAEEEEGLYADQDAAKEAEEEAAKVIQPSEPITRDVLVEWFKTRAAEMDDKSGQLANSLEMLELGASCGLHSELSVSIDVTRQLCMLVYDLNATDMTLHSFEALTPPKRLQLFLQHCPIDPSGEQPPPPAAPSAAEAKSEGVVVPSGGGGAVAAAEAVQERFEEFARVHLLPFLRLQPDGSSLLREHMISLASCPIEEDIGALPRCAALVHASRHVLPPTERLLRPLSLLIDTVLRCVYVCPRRDEDALDLMTMMYKALPSREVAEEEAMVEAEGTAVEEEGEGEEAEEGTAAAASALHSLLDELDDLERSLRAQQHLREYGLLQAMGEYRQQPEASPTDGQSGGHTHEIRGLSSERGHYVLRALARQVARRAPPATGAQWAQTRDDMEAVWTEACSHTLPASLPYSEWLQALLLAGRFQLAADYLRTSHAHILDDGTAESLVLAAAREYFDSASSSHDASLERASDCLRVLPQASASVATEQRLLDGVRQLYAYGCTLLPLQVRLHQDRLQIILDLIHESAARATSAAASAAADDGGGPPPITPSPSEEHTPITDLQLEPLERLAEALGVGGDESCDRLASAIARLALTRGDTKRALELTLRLLSTGYAPAWQLGIDLCSNPTSSSSLSLAARGAILAHAVAHCPPDRFAECLMLWRAWRGKAATTRDHVAAQEEDMPTGGEGGSGAAADALPPLDVTHIHMQEDLRREVQKAADGGVASAERSKAGGSSRVMDDDPNDCVELASRTMRSVGLCKASTLCGEMDAAVAYLADRPSLTILVKSGDGLHRLLMDAAEAGDEEEVARIATLGYYAFSLILTASRQDAAKVVPSALRANRRSQLAALTTSNTAGGAAGGGCEEAAIARMEYFSRVIERLKEGRVLQRTLPSINIAKYAADEAVRAASVRKLASCGAPNAFEMALALAPDVRLDKWEMHMACVEEGLLGTVEGGGGTGGAPLATDGHEEALLEAPLRLSRALSERVFNEVPYNMPTLLGIVTLMVKAESRLRQEHQKRLSTGGGGGGGEAGSGDAPPPVPTDLLEHNAELLLEFRYAMKALHKAAPDTDPRTLLHLGCHITPSTDHVKLSITLPQRALESWRYAVTPSNAIRLALLAPQMALCLQLGGGSATPAPAATITSPFTSSAVWSEVLMRRLRDGEECITLLSRLTSSDLSTLLLRVRPKLRRDEGYDEDGFRVRRMESIVGVPSLPLPTLVALLTAAATELRTRLTRDLTTRTLQLPPASTAPSADRLVEGFTKTPPKQRPAAAAYGNSSGGGGGVVAGPPPENHLHSFRLVSTRLLHLRTLEWLLARVEGVGGTEEERTLLDGWAVSGGEASKELSALMAYVCGEGGKGGDAPRRADTVGNLLPLWRMELTRRAAADGGDSGGGGDGMEAAVTASKSMASFTEYCAESLLTSTAFESIGRLLLVTRASNLAIPTRLISYTRDSTKDERRRLSILQLISDANAAASSPSSAPASAFAAAASATTPDGESDEDIELLLHLNARCVLRAAWGAAAAEEEDGGDVEGLLESALPAGKPLYTIDGAKHAFGKICDQLEVGGGDGRMEVVTRQRLLALASLLTSWRGPIERSACKRGGVVLSNAPTLHTECSTLLHHGLRLSGVEIIVPLRLAMPSRPILTEGEEEGLIKAIRKVGDEDSSLAVSAAIERACTACGLLSGRSHLEQQAIQSLAAIRPSPPPPPDIPLLSLLVQGGYLPTLALTSYWRKLLPVLSSCDDAKLIQGGILSLGHARLYRQAGSIVLCRGHTHPSLHSPSAQLAALRGYVRREMEARQGGEMEVAEGGSLAALERLLLLRSRWTGHTCHVFSMEKRFTLVSRTLRHTSRTRIPFSRRALVPDTDTHRQTAPHLTTPTVPSLPRPKSRCAFVPLSRPHSLSSVCSSTAL